MQVKVWNGVLVFILQKFILSLNIHVILQSTTEPPVRRYPATAFLWNNCTLACFLFSLTFPFQKRNLSFLSGTQKKPSRKQEMKFRGCRLLPRSLFRWNLVFSNFPPKVEAYFLAATNHNRQILNQKTHLPGPHCFVIAQLSRRLVQ